MTEWIDAAADQAWLTHPLRAGMNDKLGGYLAAPPEIVLNDRRHAFAVGANAQNIREV